MAKIVQGAVLATVAAFLLHAAPAAAEIRLKSGCDGKWVAREGSGFETYMVCERQPAAAKPRFSAIRMRAQRKVAHLHPHRPVIAHYAVHDVPAPAPVIVAANATRRDAECLTLLCPQFIMVGVGY